MSSKPHTEGVAEVLALLARADELDAELTALRAAAVRMRKAEEERGNVSRRLSELLRSMDLEAKGNYGWENRFGWFLAELRRQAKDAGKERP